MSEPGVTHSTFVIERVYDATPERLFDAFSSAETKRRWFAEGEESEVKSFEMDFRVGGWEHSRFQAPGGHACSNETIYLDIVPGRRIVFAYTMAVGGRRISSSQSTVEMIRTAGGSRLVFTEQAAFFEGADGPQMRKQGWNDLLTRLGEVLA